MPIRDAIRWNIWRQLLGNVCFNPISALTLATLDRVTSETSLRALCKTMMKEAQAVAAALGVIIPDEMMERRLDAAGAVTGHKMSMLQDLERRRSIKVIDALVTAIHEIGQLVGITTPTIDTVLALVQERGRQAGLYAGCERGPIKDQIDKYICKDNATAEKSPLAAQPTAPTRRRRTPK